ncbi:putative lipid-binding transport protein (Tim44 family) [Desulfobaculum xiamenense]|uniref:Putative lipid-binding transport protein (Tim44 family) n=1 Tax=Desulfobaculum xiamenense TaxID=995050 RepID=A0A846QPH7_9BACT|nr:Tim44-like domain-containing protein [Desulfobaculum xiamenense]NJB67315.1 putative lipid-binding transport protein (Tim44 family) [Desulfobaculum xiamenense]
MRLTPLDLLLIGICIFLALRFLAARKNDGDDSAQDEAVKKRALDAYKRAERAWDMLRSDTESDDETPPRPAALHGEFDPNEFLAGAKLAYARIRESWDARDLDDLRNFTTPRAFDEFASRAETETRSARTDLLLVNASIVERRNNGVTEEASVLFDVTQRTGQDAGTTSVQEVWKFARDAENDASHWKLDSMETVRQH